MPSPWKRHRSSPASSGGSSTSRGEERDLVQQNCRSKGKPSPLLSPSLIGEPRVLDIDSAVFNLEHTLASGQSFRWQKVGKAFIGVVSGHLIYIEQKGNRLLYRSLPRNVPSAKLRDYFGLNGAFAAALRSFPEDPLLLKALERFRGMRLLRQEPWETLISFIISSNNNINRIRSCIENLCRTFGREIQPGCGYYTFPGPEALSQTTLTVLREGCNLGYRHKYVADTAREVFESPHLLSDIAALSYPDARKRLMKLPGVGPKVADCILLYSMGKLEAFPIDTWIRKIIQDNYFNGEKVSLSKMQAFARQRFGPFAGYAQLYLFQCAMTRVF